MPSTPRLSTPERSATSSPEAARRSGVEAVIAVRMKLTEKISLAISTTASSMGRHRPWRARQQADAIDDHGIAGEDVEQQDTLEHLGKVKRHLQRDLRLLAADEGERQEQGGDQDAERIEPPEKRDDDGGEAVAGRDARLQMSDRPGDLDDA